MAKKTVPPKRDRRQKGKPQKNQNKKTQKPKVSRHHKPENLELEEWQRILRKQFGEQQDFILKNIGDHPFFSDFFLTNPKTEMTYKISIRGDGPSENFCTCPDYRINYLGTCKHIEFALFKLKKKRGAKKAFQEGHILPFSEVYLHYGLKREVRFRKGHPCPPEVSELVRQFFDSRGILKEERILSFHHFLSSLPQNGGHEIWCHDDVMSFIAEHQDAEYRKKIIRSKIKEGVPLFDKLLKTRLYPYQKEGVLFALQAGRCLLGDDMGLGKTLQALAASELMARLFGVQRVLIVSPTTLKYQWKSEIEKFSTRSACVIEGMNQKREQLYREDSFYKLVNYELIYRDFRSIGDWAPDLIILDEAQRIKNWKTRTAKSVKKLRSPFALVLTGTPIENRIEELHSIMEFVDQRNLGPLYRFVEMHRIVDEGGKVVGYKDLHKIRESLKHVFMRRKKDEVLKQLPERRDKNFFVPMTKEQYLLHDEQMELVARLVAKWRRFKFLCEADQRRLQIALNFMRMAADNTYLVDKKTVHGPKIEELEVLLKELVLEGGQKAVIFSQWLRMTELVEGVLKNNSIQYVHLNGSVPSKQRKDLMARFKDDPACKVFLSTDAGGVGLNLQSGSVVINMDIPWNPAVLEQRIGRVHRLGQKRAVQVINFVSSSSIESRILDLLQFKRSLFTGALDGEGENVVMVGDSQLKRLMKTVEVVAEGIEKSDPVRAKEEREEAERDERLADLRDQEERGEKVPVAAGAPSESDQLGNLLKMGAELLNNLSKAFSEGPELGKKGVESLIGKDEKTEKSFIKIPLPEKNVVKKLFSSLGELISRAM